MTTELEALVEWGAVLSREEAEPTHASNVDKAKLEAYARRAIAAFVPSLAQQPMVPNQLQVGLSPRIDRPSLGPFPPSLPPPPLLCLCAA